MVLKIALEFDDPKRLNISLSERLGSAAPNSMPPSIDISKSKHDMRADFARLDSPQPRRMWQDGEKRSVSLCEGVAEESDSGALLPK